MIKRRLNPEWDPRNPSGASRFLLDPLWHDEVPYWGLFDMLGLFLSLHCWNGPEQGYETQFLLPINSNVC